MLAFPMKRIWLGLFLSCIACIGCSVDREYDCGDHGEYAEGDCVCERGWIGIYCDEWVVDRHKGDYALISDTCGILWRGMDSIHVTTSTVMPLGFFINAKGLRNAITAEYTNASDYATIPLQKVTAITAPESNPHPAPSRSATASHSVPSCSRTAREGRGDAPSGIPGPMSAKG